MSQKLFDDLTEHLSAKVLNSFSDVMQIAPEGMHASIVIYGALSAVSTSAGLLASIFNLEMTDQTRDVVTTKIVKMIQASIKDPESMGEAIEEGLIELSEMSGSAEQVPA